ncbi:hypothetical protein Tco_1408081 [Tanacetum coccineum]
MTTLKFADTQNMVAFVAKPVESEGFEQIVDFLNANPIRYALTINPTIYTSCIEKFWATVKILFVEDAECDCLPNATIFEQLTLMSSKTTAWNKFSSTMASAIICLATNQKFNFSKYIFESMVKNLDNVGNFFDVSKVPQPSGLTTKVADEAINEEMNDSLVRAATTASSLEAEQDSGNIDKTQSKATPNEPSSLGTSLSGGPRRQETIRDIIAQTRSENVSKHFSDPLLAREFLLWRLQKDTSSNEIAWFENRRVKKLREEVSRCIQTAMKEDLCSVSDEDITLVNDDNKMFDAGTLTGDEVLAEKVVAAKDVNLSVDEVTLAQALAALKSAKDSTATTTTATIPTPRKGIIFQELERIFRLDEEIASKLQAKFDEEVILAREKAGKEQEANVALTKEWDDIQAKIEADHELAQRLQAQEEKELSDVEKARLFIQLLEKRRKHFVEKRAEEKRNRPLTRAQQKSIMRSYLKNMEGWKPKSLKNKSFANIEIWEEGWWKQESSKRQKLEEDKESEELKQCLEIISDDGDDITIDATHLSTKSPTILQVDYECEMEFELLRLVKKQLKEGYVPE